MSLHRHIIASFNQPVDSKYLGMVKNIRLAFERKYHDNAKIMFDKWLLHYKMLCRHTEFWNFEPGQFIYHFNRAEIQPLFVCERFEPSSISEVRKIINE